MTRTIQTIVPSEGGVCVNELRAAIKFLDSVPVLLSSTEKRRLEKRRRFFKDFDLMSKCDADDFGWSMPQKRSFCGMHRGAGCHNIIDK